MTGRERESASERKREGDRTSDERGLGSAAMMETDIAAGNDDGAATTAIGKMRGTLAFPDRDADTIIKMAPNRSRHAEHEAAAAARCKSGGGGGVRVQARGRMGTEKPRGDELAAGRREKERHTYEKRAHGAVESSLRYSDRSSPLLLSLFSASLAPFLSSLHLFLPMRARTRRLPTLPRISALDAECGNYSLFR